MKYCDYCKKKIEGMNYIQVTFLGKLQQIPNMFKREVQLEFCSFNCFQEYFNLFVKEQFEAEERWRQEYEKRFRSV